MELKDTVDLMTSADYKERFLGEYRQLKIRYDKLKAMTDKWDQGHLEFTPTCPREIYDIQLRAMEEYLAVLVVRARMEKIELA